MEKDSQKFLLISYLKSLQNSAQKYAKSLHATINLPLQCCPFSRNSSWKTQQKVFAHFLPQCLEKFSSNFCKSLMQTLICLCNVVHSPGIIHAKAKKNFLLIYFVKSLQNTPQPCAKSVHSNVNVPLQSVHFPDVINAPNSQVFLHIANVITPQKNSCHSCKRGCNVSHFTGIDSAN